jgi:sn-glycerol 3-phosphate transport system permease protein
LAAWGLAILWILPLAYAVWTAFHPAEFSAKFSLTAPLTLENFARAWEAAPFARYFLNTTLLVSLILGSQPLLCTLAAYAFVRHEFRGKKVVFALVLVQLMIMPDVLLVENYKTMSRLGLIDTLFGIGLPYFASAFAIFLLRQTFKGIPKELVEAATMEGASALQILWRVYVPREARVCGVCAGVGELPLEQLPVAAGGDQFGQFAATHRRPAGICVGRSGH